MPATLPDFDTETAADLPDFSGEASDALPDFGASSPGEIAGTVNEFKRGLLGGQQQIIGAQLESTPRRPTLLQKFGAFQSAINDPAYQEALSLAGGDPAKLKQVEKTLGPTARTRRLEESLGLHRQFLAEDIAGLEKAQQAIPSSDAMAEWNAADNSNWWKALAKNPVEITAGIMAQSLPAMAPGMALNVVAPGGRVAKAAGTGLGSTGVEMANSYLDAARQAGYDFRDPDKVREFFENPEAQAKAERFALQRGVPIGIFDALTAGIAGKFAGPALRKSAGKVVVAAGQETALQAAGGAAGEFAGQVSAGQPLSLKDIMGEALGEIASGPQEIISNLRERQSAIGNRLPAIATEPAGLGQLPEYDEFGMDEAPPPAEEVQSPESRVQSPPAESDAARFAREQREAMAELRALKAAQEVSSLESEVLSPPGPPPAEVPPPIQPSTNPSIQVTDDHRAQARTILTEQSLPEDAAPSVFDDLDSVTRGPIQFPIDQAQTILNAKDSAAEATYQKPYAKLAPVQRKKINAQLRMATDAGMPADQALQALAQNPKYAGWTADDLAQAMASSARVSPASVSPAAVESLAAEIAAAESPESKGMRPESRVQSPESAAPDPFSLGPVTQQRVATVRSAAVAANPDQPVAVVHDPNWHVNGALVEGTIENGTIVLNAAAPGYWTPDSGLRTLDSQYVAAKVRHETAHVRLTSSEGQAQLQRLAGKLTAAQRADLQALGYIQPPGLSDEAYDHWLTNEFIARQAENNSAWWQRYVAHVKAWLSGQKGLRDITNEEVAQAILRALRRSPESRVQSPESAYSLAPDSRQGEFDNWRMLAKLKPYQARYIQALQEKADRARRYVRDGNLTIPPPEIKGSGSMVLRDDAYGEFSADQPLSQRGGDLARGREQFHVDPRTGRLIYPPPSEFRALREAQDRLGVYSLAGPQTDTRRLSRQLDAATWLTPEQRASLVNRIYRVANLPAARAAAVDLVQTLGLHPAADVVLDATLPIPGAVRAQLMQQVARGLAAESPGAYADFMNRAIHQTTDAGQFIAHLKGWAESTPDGAVATALRILDGASEKVIANYHTLLSAAQDALSQAHTTARTETLKTDTVQKDAAAAVDAAIVADPAVQKAIREEARQALANEEATRNMAAAALPPGSDITDVLNVVLDHFRFGESPESRVQSPESTYQTLTQKLSAAGVPASYADGFARGLDAAWKRKVEKLQADLPKHLRNLRISKQVLEIAEDIVRDYTGKAQSATARLKAKFIQQSNNPTIQSYSLAPADQETISDLADVAGGLLVRDDITLTEWTAYAVREFGQGVAPYLDSAFALAQERLAAERGKRRPGAGGRPAKGLGTQDSGLRTGPALPDSELNRLLRAKLREWRMKMADAIGRPQAGRELGDAIVKDSGLTGPAADKLRERLNRRFAELATKRKQAALDKLAKGQPDSKPVKSLQAALNKLIDLHNAGALDDQKFADAIKAALGLKTLTPAETARLRQLAQDIQAIPEDQAQRRQAAAIKLAAALARLRPGHWWEFPMGIWYAHILSGPMTHVVNAAGNAINLAGTLTAVTALNPARLQQIIPQLARGTRQALPEMWHALSEGSTTGPRIGEKYNDPGVWEKVDSKWLLPWKLVGRALAAGDLLFFYPAYQIQQGLLARAIAKSEGLGGRALNRRVSEILFNTPAARSAAAAQATQEGYTGPKHRSRIEEIIQAQRDQHGNFNETGRDFALRTTFNNQPYGLLGAIAGGINSIGASFPAVRFLFPFTNIIANVTNESLNYTPIGSLRALAARYGGAKLYGKEVDVTAWADQEALAVLHARAALGTLLLGALMLKAASYADDDDPPFMITGSGPTDANQRKTLSAAGWLPNSVKLGDRYYSFLNTPLAVPMAVIGNMFDARKYGKLDDADALDRAALVMSMSARSIVQQSFLDSLARFLGALEHPNPSKAGRGLADWAGRTASSFAVPNALRQVDQIFDPAKYDDPTVKGELLRHIPFARANDRPTLNGLGEPITRPLSERFTKLENPDPLWRELARLNIGVYPMNLEHQGERLTEDQLYELTRISGPKIRADLERIIALPAYQRWDEKTKEAALDKVIQGRHKEAKMKVVRSQ